jgi:hypothetical protein
MGEMDGRNAMRKPGRRIQVGDLVVCAYEEASRLMRDPEVASMLAAWVVQRVLKAEDNRRTALALMDEAHPLRRRAA